MVAYTHRRPSRPEAVSRYHFSLTFRCQCGQTRHVTTSLDARGHKPGHFVMPCCLSRYDIVGWKDGRPVCAYYGREDWTPVQAGGKPRIIGRDGSELPWPGET